MLDVKTIAIPVLSHDQLDRFHAHIDSSAGKSACWNWTGCRKPRCFHGNVTIGMKQFIPSRVAYALAFGLKTVDGRVVAHHCDNPGCCNPGHLFLTDPAGNNADRDCKGRFVAHCTHGEDWWASKLTDAAVRDIRSSTKRGKDLAVQYGVSETTISEVRHNKIWRHVI